VTVEVRSQPGPADVAAQAATEMARE
jgi:hypothetical protein